MKDEDSGTLRPVLIGLGALLGVSLLIGGVISVAALGVADLAGVRGDGSTGRATSGQTNLVIPSPSAAEDPAEPELPAESEPTAAPARPEKTKGERPRQPITLEASPASVSAFERINLTGTYRNAPGATLQVQRFSGGWVDFPVTATVRNDTFATYVQSGIAGRTRFRVVDKSTGRSSRPVSVDIG